jgi:hypothetical protein
VLALAEFLAVHALYLILLTLTAAWIGRGLTGRLRFDSWLEEAAISLGLGLGVLGYLVLLLGLFGWLTRGFLLAGIGLLTAATAPAVLRRLQELRAVAGRRPLRQRLAALGLLVAVGLLALPLLALPLYPPTDWDATAYHMAQAKIFVAEERVVATPYLRFAVFPQLNEMLFTLGFAVLDEAAAQQAELVVLAALLLAVAAWGRRHLSLRAGLWAAALLLGHPLVAWLGTTAYVDLGLCLFLTLAAACLWNWSAEGAAAGRSYLAAAGRPWLVLAGIFLGFALGTKYLGLFAVGLLGLGVLWVAVRRREWAAPWVLAAVAAVVAAPWYVRNAWITGNPLFPFYPQVFGPSPWWSAADMASVLWSLREGYGIGRTPGALLRLPWALLATPEKFAEGAALGVVSSVLVGLAVVVAVRDRRLRAYLAFGLGLLVLWWANAQVLRFLVPALPPLALAAAGALDRLAGPRLVGRRWGGAAAVALALAFAWPAWHGAVERRRGRVTPPPVTAAERDSYLALHLPTYPAYRWLNARHGRDYTVYALHDANMAYFADGTFQGDWFGPGRYAQLTGRAGDPAGLQGALRALGADYLLVPAAHAGVLGGVAPPRFRPVLAGPWGVLHAVEGGRGAR